MLSSNTDQESRDRENASPIKKTVLKYSDRNNGITREVSSLDQLLDTELHYLIFKNDLNILKNTLNKYKKEKVLENKIGQKDKFGNTPLHIAVMLGNLESAKLLLESGCKVKIRNEQFWTPMHEAISLKNRDLVKCLYKKYIEEVKQEFENSVPVIKASLKEMLDFYVEIKWDFESWIPFVSRFLPSDVCKVYKKGTMILIDTSLEDVSRAAQNSENSSDYQMFSPLNWNRGDLSFIIDIQQDKNKSSIIFLDNNKKTFIKIDPRQSEMADLEGDELEKELDFLLSTEIVNVRLDTKNAEFATTETGWISKRAKTEKINGYFASYYDIKNLFIVSKVRVEHLSEDDLKKKEMEQKKILEYLGGKSEQTSNYLEFSAQENTDSKSIDLSNDENPQLITWEDYSNHPADKFPNFGRKIKLKENRKEFKGLERTKEQITFTNIIYPPNCHSFIGG